MKLSGAIIAWAVSIVAVSGCKNEEPSAVLGGAACRASCAAFVGAGCVGSDGQRACVESCERTGRTADRVGCEQERGAYLDCVARSRPECAGLSCSAAQCIERGAGLSACQREHGTYRDCLSPCERVGSARATERAGEVNGRKGVAKLEASRAGCQDCPSELARGAPAGGRCQAASVCVQVCCDCASSPARFLARVCFEGACLGAKEACALLDADADLCR